MNMANIRTASYNPGVLKHETVVMLLASDGLMHLVGGAHVYYIPRFRSIPHVRSSVVLSEDAGISSRVCAEAANRRAARKGARSLGTLSPALSECNEAARGSRETKAGAIQTSARSLSMVQQDAWQKLPCRSHRSDCERWNKRTIQPLCLSWTLQSKEIGKDANATEIILGDDQKHYRKVCRFSPIAMRKSHFCDVYHRKGVNASPLLSSKCLRMFAS